MSTSIVLATVCAVAMSVQGQTVSPPKTQAEWAKVLADQNPSGDLNGDGVTNLVDFYIWKQRSPDSCESGQSIGPAWPYEKFGSVNSAFCQPNIDRDLNGDGLPDVLAFATRSIIPGDPGTMTPGLYAFNNDGSEFLDGDSDPSSYGVFRKLDADDLDKYCPPPLARFDSGLPKIIYADHHAVYAMNASGTSAAGNWPFRRAAREMKSNVFAPRMSAPATGDGYDNLIFFDAYDSKSDSQFMYMTDRFGNLAPGWPVELKQLTFGRDVFAAAVGELVPSSAGLETAIVSSPFYLQTPGGVTIPHKLYVMSANGQKLWEQDVPHILDIVIADTNYDGKNEIVAVFLPDEDQAAAEGHWSHRIAVFAGNDGHLIWDYYLDLGPYYSESSFDPDTHDLITHNSHDGPVPEGYNYQIILSDLRSTRNSLQLIETTRYSETSSIFHADGTREATLLADNGAVRVITLGVGLMSNFSVPIDYMDLSGSNSIAIGAIGDVTGDGEADIIAYQLSWDLRQEYIKVWDRFGVEMNGWTLDVDPSKESWWFRILPFMSPTLGDINLDKRMDIAATLPGGDMYIFQTCAPFNARVLDYSKFRYNDGRTGEYINKRRVLKTIGMKK